jgi:acyl dehydratase
MIRVDGVVGMEGLVGQHLGWSDPYVITQDRVDAFADVTDDHQWIHVDPDRARTGPFGKTVAHGYLTLALLPFLFRSVWRVDGFSTGINYGLGKVRFPAPVPVGSAIRGGFSLVEISKVPGGVQATVGATVEVLDADKPSCVAELLYRYYE